eukprot:CAMPEP_0117427646 /NCGR_PEP_ID=MMETSP0758-20121206/7469_1 /TAXON_ID=63605 /ORGANISM="Percolomonas cosmopolitus, Strain AE-1 (ATCC 50343)" /LENGTH=305 /DNA_ID=CAMNT_0005213441 /DNA_START=370 /DNA_END=1284 /DNA_ORIENTATION=+
MMGKSAPPRATIERLFHPHQHIVAFATQECERSITSSMVNRKKASWDKLLDTIGHDKGYVGIGRSTLCALHLVVFIKKELVPYMDSLVTSQVACGVMNEIGNKGGASVSFKLGDTSIMIIGAHLAASKKNTKLRHANYRKIIQQMMYKHKPIGQHKEDSDVEPLLRDFDHVLFMGDLNYRVDLEREKVDELIQHHQYHVCLKHDQLLQKLAVPSDVFRNFNEAEILFAPTYKFDPDSTVYDTSSKKRVPSWTDRILYRHKPNFQSHSMVLSYDADFTNHYSDHRPVYARMLLSTHAVKAPESPVK